MTNTGLPTLRASEARSEGWDGETNVKKSSLRYSLGVALSMAVFASAAAEPPSRQPTPVNVDIKSQPIGAALNELAQQAGFQVLLFTDAAGDLARPAPALVGKFTTDEALLKLLANTGLTFSYVNDRTIAVRRVEDPAATNKTTRQEVPPPRMRLANDVQSPQTAGGISQVSTDTQEDRRGRIEEVIVTAQKRAENLQDVPLSISVVTAADIDRRGMVGAEDYLRGVPGANHVDSANGQSIVIRGMETSPLNQNIFSGATTATYFGETPTTSSAGLGGGTNIDLKLVDIERVEVLRGPQGTSFGNSSLGGAVRTIPVAPKLDRSEAKVAAGYSVTSGNGGDNYNVQAVGNVPLVDEKLAIRGTVYQYVNSGFYRNRAGSDPQFQSSAVELYGSQAFAKDEDEVGSSDVIGGRIAATWQANNDLSFTLNYLKQTSEMDGMPAANSGRYEQTMLQVAPEHVVRGETAGINDTDIEIINGVAEYNLGAATLLGTYSYTKGDSTVVQPYQLYGQPWPASFYGDSEHREHVGEVRLTTQFDGPLNFLAGVYYEDVKDDVLFTYYWYGDTSLNFFNPNERLVGDQGQAWELTQKAAYGEASWELLPQFTLTGGVRAYDYERTVNTFSPSSYFFAPVPSGTSTETGDASGTNLRANLSYQPTDDAMLYLGWSQGFRLGKPQTGLPSCDANGDGIIDGTSTTVASTTQVKPDEVDSYELGGKFAFFDRRLTIDAAVFRMEWSEIPVRVAAGTLTTGCGLIYVTNAGDAKSEGVELQASIQLSEPLRLDVGGSWIRAQLTEDVPAQQFRAGDRLPGSPKVNANLGLQYEFDVGGHEAFVRADSSYVGEFYDDVFQSPNLRSGDYFKLDASARVKFQSLSVDLYVRNLTDEDAFTFRGAFAGTGEFFGYRLRPRTIGVQLGYEF